jgi:polysaccharide biosynthesis protein PslH
MRLLVISSVAPYPPLDGVSIPVYESVRALARRHAVTLAHFDASDYEADRNVMELLGVERLVRLPRRSKFLSTLPPYWPELMKGVPFAIFPFCNRKARTLVRDTVRDGGFDGIICHLILTSALAPTDSTVPKCLVIQDVVHHVTRANVRYERHFVRRLYNRLHGYMLRRYERREYKRFDALTVVSVAERKNVEALGVSHATVVPNGIDADFFSSACPVDMRRDLVYLGNLSSPRNEEAAWIAASDIFPRVRVRVPSTKMCIVGIGPSRRLIELAASKRNVLVTGQVEDVRPYLERSRVLICPQNVATGIKNSVLQSLAMGIPTVVSSAVAEGLEGTAGNDYLVANSRSEFADAAVALLNDDSLAGKLSAAGRRLIVERYSWENYADALVTLLGEQVPSSNAGNG